MRERIYTIPVNEAFEQCGDGCPLCRLYEKLEDTELDLILGASMMEPDVRQKTNELGFCAAHYRRMFTMKNRLGMGLMLESHLTKLQNELTPGGVFSRDPSDKPIRRISDLEGSCYVCDRIEEKFSKMLETAVYLYQTEDAFREMLKSTKMICLPHCRRILAAASGNVPKKVYSELFSDISGIMLGYLNILREDVSWFCRKFDYRYDDQPWGNSRDSVERSIRFLTGGSERTIPGSGK